MPDDYPDNAQTTGTVTVGGSVTGDIESFDERDWFAVTLVADRIYQFDLEGAPTDRGTLYNPYLSGIYDAGGNGIGGTRNDDGGFGRNSRVTFRATEDATYYVSAGTYAWEGTYTLSVTDVTASVSDDFTAWTGTTGAVTVGNSATGDIDFAGDRDWFAVTLEEGKSYRFDLEGSPTDSGTLYDPYLHGIYDEGGNRINGTRNNNGGSGNNSRVMFAATDTATYYVSAGAHSYSNAQGTYKLSVMDVTESFSDDFTGGTGTTGTVTVGGSVTGEIDFLGDSDWFAVTLVAGSTYRFDLKGSGAVALPDPYLRGIYDAAGTLIDGTTNDDGGSGRNSRVTFVAPAGGTYYVSAGVWLSPDRNPARNEQDDLGTYTLSVTDVTASVSDDFTAGTNTTGAVTVGGSVTGAIDFAGDIDWFAVTLDAGKFYRFDLEGSDDGVWYDPYLYGLYDAEGNYISGTRDNDGGHGNNSQMTFAATEDATYYLSVGPRVGAYKLSVTDITSDFTTRPDTTGVATVGGSVTSDIEFYGDRDWFAVTLDAGQTYRFDLEGIWTGGGTLSDPHLYGIYDADGDLIDGTRNNDGGSGRNSRVMFTAPDTATYYVSAGADNDNGEGTYALSVREFVDDFTAGTDTAGTVTVGGSATGEIEIKYDSDWFAVTLDAGNIYRFDLEGTGDGALANPYLYGIYDAEGNYISGTTNDDGGSGRNSRVTLAATEGGTYYVSAGANSREGAYALSVTDVTASFSNDLTAATDTTGTVTVGGSVTGSIDFVDDRDWFAVTLVAGTTYRFDLEGTGAGALYDPYLRGIYDADGNYISDTTDDDDGSGLNSRVTFAAPAGGTYYVSAGAFRGREGTYTLSVTDVTASFSNDLTAGTGTTGTVTVGGSVTGSIDFVDDRDWFAVTLDAGTTYRFDLEGTGAGALYDPYLRGIYDAAGNYISDTRNDDDGSGYNSRVRFTATADAVHYVSAGAYRDSLGDYTLSVEEVM